MPAGNDVIKSAYEQRLKSYVEINKKVTNSSRLHILLISGQRSKH